MSSTAPAQPTRAADPLPPPQWHFEVTARDIRRFRQAIGEDGDGWSAEGDEALAPPLFCQAMAWRDVPAACLPVDGAPVELDAGPPDARVVGGASDFRVHRPVRAGETIGVGTQTLGVQTRQGRSGRLHLLTLRTCWTDAAGQMVAEEQATFVKREGVADARA